MTENQLLTFDTIIKTGSFKQASIELHKSQSSLSVAIKNLEEELGFLLLDRSKYRPQITEKGKIFYARSQALLQNYQDLRSFAQELKGVEKPLIKISIDCVIPFSNVLNILNSFQRDLPSTRLQIRTDAIDGGIEQLNSDSVEMAIIPKIDIPNNVHKEKITTINFRPCISPKAYEELGGEYGKLPRIIISSSSSKGMLENKAISEEKEVWQVNDHNYKAMLIKNGLAWGNLPIQMFEEDLELGNLMIIKESQEGDDLDFYLAKKKSTYLSESSKHLWNLIVKDFS